MVIKIIDNEPKYYEFIRTLRNDPRVQDGFIENANITEEAQNIYMKKYKNNYIVALINDEPVGYAGSIEKDIRVCVKPEAQNKGIGVLLINELMNRFPNSYAKIKINNEASKTLFKKCGFKEIFIIMEKTNAPQSI
jgi:ribosomal protein S18 acetylase RimI-like enzyme